MTHTVVGLFEDRAHAQAAMNELIAAGFIKENIDISNRSFVDGPDDDATAGEGIGDRIANFFNSLFGDDEDTARNYANAATDADAILTVQADSDERAQAAQEIFDRHGAFDVDERSAYAEGNFRGDAARAGAQGNATIPVVEERMNVGKEQVERGGARIRSRIIERPVEENVRLREEHVVVNRRPVDREVTDADMQNFRPGEMEITERAEVPIVGKEARVVEEVEVGKNVTERNETIRDTVRGTDVDVEKIGTETKGKKAKRARP